MISLFGTNKEELPEAQIEVGKYGNASGLNSIGSSLISKIGLKPESDIPWLAFIIPTFVFISWTTLFFLGGKKRKEKQEEQLLSATSAAQNYENSVLTKSEVAIRAGIFAAVIVLSAIYLF